MLCVRQVDGDEFASLRDDWDGLLARSRSNTMFLTWEWLYSWWKCFKGSKSLFILSVWESDGVLVGIAPLFIAQERHFGALSLKVVRFMGVERVSSEYLDFILAEGKEAEAMTAILQYLEAHRDLWDFIVLSDMLECSSNLRLLQTVLRAQKIPHFLKVAEICPYIALPSTYEVYLNRLSENMRYHVRRRFKGLNKLGTVNVTKCEENGNLTLELDRLFALHEKRWLARNHAGNFGHDAVRRFHRNLAPLFTEKGWMRLRSLTVDGEQVGMLYGFAYNGTFYYYQSGFDPLLARWSPGVVLMGLCIEEAILNGLFEFDYLRGDEVYKWKWTNSFRKTINLHIYQNRFKSRWVQFCDQAKASLKEAVGRLVKSDVVAN